MEKVNIIGIYDDPDQLTLGVRKIKEGGYKIKNIFSPFPVHEIWEILKMKTWLPVLIFIAGTLGAASTFLFLWWTSAVNYPLKFGGKPLTSLSFVVITFVLTILIAVIASFMLLFLRQKIGPGKKAVLPDSRSIDDKFIIIVERDPSFTESDLLKINNLLKESGASEIFEKPEPLNDKEERDE